MTEQIDGIEWIKYDWNEYKLNAFDSSPQLSISANGRFALMHTGPNGMNSVRSVLPIQLFNLKGISKTIIAFYFEMELSEKLNSESYVSIGFCDSQFPLEERLGLVNNTIAIYSKQGIWIDGTQTKFENCGEWFKKGDFVGVGIIHQSNGKMECFVTWNGQLLGKKPNYQQNFLTLNYFRRSVYPILAIQFVCTLTGKNGNSRISKVYLNKWGKWLQKSQIKGRINAITYNTDFFKLNLFHSFFIFF